MITLLRNWIFNQLNKRYGLCFREVVNEIIQNKPLNLIKGTISSSPDYDDAWSLALAVRSENIFDVGANVGKTAILYLSSVTTIQKIILIDPNPYALGIAAENLFLNNLSTNAIFIPAFASDSFKTIEFWTIGSGSAGSMFATHAKTARACNSSITVPTLTLDSLSKYYRLIPDYVKIDVEGAESLVLDGSTDIDSKNICKYLVEMHSSKELPMEANAFKILTWCKNHCCPVEIT